MSFIDFNNKKYPVLTARGNAAQFIIPYAKYFCFGEGYDIGCAKIEWSLPGSIPIDKTLNSDFDAYNLPNKKVDYIFSSHCLEHLDDWVYALDYWISKLKINGCLLLYLPHYTQEYWRPWNNRKHYHAFTEQILHDYFIQHKDICKETLIITGPDLNYSFAIHAKKIADTHIPKKHKTYILSSE
jgi:SAM-dependent methyltransferase